MFRNLRALSAIVFGDQTLFASSESLVRSIEVMSIILLNYTDILSLDRRQDSLSEVFDSNSLTN